MSAFALWMIIAALTGLAVGYLLGQAATRRHLGRTFAAAQRQHQTETDALLDGIKLTFAEITADQNRRTGEDMLKLAQSSLHQERRLDSERITADRSALESRLRQMMAQMERVQEMVRQLEQDRSGQLGALATQLEHAAKGATRLNTVTERLTRALSNTYQRGQWGERLAEDLLRSAGLREGVSYERQRALPNGTRPDFTFSLPGGDVLHMDAKFPFDNFERSLAADDKATRERLEAAFLRDVRQRLSEVFNRGYATPEYGSIDLALMFVPNERVFAAMLELAPTLVDEGLRRRVALVSPTSLIAVLAVIRQSASRYRVSVEGRELAKQVEAFLQQWQRFKAASDDTMRQVDSAAQAVRRLTGRRALEIDAVVGEIREWTSAAPAASHVRASENAPDVPPPGR